MLDPYDGNHAPIPRPAALDKNLERLAQGSRKSLPARNVWFWLPLYYDHGLYKPVLFNAAGSMDIASIPHDLLLRQLEQYTSAEPIKLVEEKQPVKSISK